MLPQNLFGGLGDGGRSIWRRGRVFILFPIHYSIDVRALLALRACLPGLTYSNTFLGIRGVLGEGGID